MRVLAEIPHAACKISIFNWNQKFLVKFELGSCEHTYKISELDVAGLDDLRARLTDGFINEVAARLRLMNEELLRLVL